MKNHDGDVKSFTHLKRAWYADANLRGSDIVDEVNFGFYSPDGGTSGELIMRWHDLNAPGAPYARLEVFEDSFHALAQVPDVIQSLGEEDEKRIQPPQFCALLERCGFVDRTETERPGGAPDMSWRDLAISALRESRSGSTEARAVAIANLSKMKES